MKIPKYGNLTLEVKSVVLVADYKFSFIVSQSELNLL